MNSENDSKENKRGIFFGVIGVLTLIVAIIGASFAYFSINVQSADNALSVQAATVQIVYEQGTQIAIRDLIPSTKEVAERSVTRAPEGNTSGYTKCIDDNGYTVCGFYDFTLTNQGTSPVNVTATVTPTALLEDQKGFTNLKYVMYNITDSSDEFGDPLYEGTTSYDEFSLLGSDLNKTMSLAVGQNKYRLFIWLDEQGEANDVEQGAIFQGTIHINVQGVTGGLTGTIE